MSSLGLDKWTGYMSKHAESISVEFLKEIDRWRVVSIDRVRSESTDDLALALAPLPCLVCLVLYVEPPAIPI